MKSKLKDKDVRNVPLLARLGKLFTRLRGHGAERDRAGNRTLHYDDYCVLTLLAMFLPLAASLRRIVQISTVNKVKRKLGITQTSLGSFSESSHLFDPTLLEPVIAELAGQLPSVTRDPRLGDLKHVVTLVDGTLLKALPRITEAMWLSSRTGAPHHAFRLHTQFELDRHIPTELTLSDGRNSGKSDEKSVLRDHLQKDHCYVMDRWYAQFKLFNDIHAIGSSYVCRVRDNSIYQTTQTLPLSDADGKANVISDQLVHLGSKQSGRTMPDHPVRLVCVQTTPHQKRSNRKGNTGAGPSDGILRIATNLLEVPAEIIALLYRYRYTIELFFRFFKQALGCKHLLSDHPNGIKIQTYCAVIAAILIQLQTGRRADKSTQFMISLYLMGIATLDELIMYINRPDNRGIKTRARDEEYRKMGINV